MESSAPVACPYCARDIVPPLRPTEDHIFTQALGGRETVEVCNECNNRLGTEVEGKLLAPNSILNLLRQVQGLGGRPVPGELGDGTAVEHDLHTGEFTHRNPVTSTLVGAERRVNFKGHPDHVRKLLKRQGLTHDEIEAQITQAQVIDVSQEWISCEVSLDLDMFVRLAAKAALGCGTLVEPDRFASSLLASGLRDLLWSRDSGGTWYPTEMLGRSEEAITRSLPPGTPIGAMPSLTAPAGKSQVVFLQWRNQTYVFATFAGFRVGGVCIDAPLPFGRGLPVVVRDEPGSAVVMSVADHAAQLAHELALQQLDQQGSVDGS